MANWKQKNLQTYNQSADALAEYFRGIGPRTTDIKKALKLAGDPENANVVEIGCGDGRDAREIVKLVGTYVGFDIAEEAIKLAKKHVPRAQFEVCDVDNFIFPDNLDVVYSFASLLHSNKEEFSAVFAKVYAALKVGGVFMISLKRADMYQEHIKTDRFGERLFYFYTPELIQELAGSSFETVSLTFSHVGSTDWFEITLRKV